MADSQEPEPAVTDPNDLLSMQLCQQGMKYIADSQAAKAQDFLEFQSAILLGPRP